jgi:hypothetical protein
MCLVVSQPLLKNTTETVAGQVVCASSESGFGSLGSRSPTDLLRIPPFRPLWVIGGHLRNCHNNKKGEETFGFSPLLLLCRNGLFVHKSKRGLTRNMPE